LNNTPAAVERYFNAPCNGFHQRKFTMKHPYLAITAGLACALSVSSPASAAEEHSMIGCLTKGATEGSYSLSHVEGGVPSVLIADSATDLSGHVGHKVEITGTTVAGDDPKTHTMKVTAMKHIDVACP
jgi:hypothetical protein